MKETSEKVNQKPTYKDYQSFLQNYGTGTKSASVSLSPSSSTSSLQSNENDVTAPKGYNEFLQSYGSKKFGSVRMKNNGRTNICTNGSINESNNGNTNGNFNGNTNKSTIGNTNGNANDNINENTNTNAKFNKNSSADQTDNLSTTNGASNKKLVRSELVINIKAPDTPKDVKRQEQQESYLKITSVTSPRAVVPKEDDNLTVPDHMVYAKTAVLEELLTKSPTLKKPTPNQFKTTNPKSIYHKLEQFANGNNSTTKIVSNTNMSNANTNMSNTNTNMGNTNTNMSNDIQGTNKICNTTNNTKNGSVPKPPPLPTTKPPLLIKSSSNNPGNIPTSPKPPVPQKTFLKNEGFRRSSSFKETHKDEDRLIRELQNVIANQEENNKIHSSFSNSPSSGYASVKTPDSMKTSSLVNIPAPPKMPPTIPSLVRIPSPVTIPSSVTNPSSVTIPSSTRISPAATTSPSSAIPSSEAIPYSVTIPSSEAIPSSLTSPSFTRTSSLPKTATLSPKLLQNYQHQTTNNHQNSLANTTTVIPVVDPNADVDKNDPNVKKLVYNTYRGMLGAYNNRANNMVSTLPRNFVVQDRGVSKQVESIASQGCLANLNGRVNPNPED